MHRTACAMRNSRAAGATLVSASSSQGLWLRDDDCRRWQWHVGGLTPLTNYTAFAVQDQMKVSRPINFVTKSAAFVCPIMTRPIFPSTGYVVPIPVPPDPAMGHTAQTIRADTIQRARVLPAFSIYDATCRIGLDAIYHQAELLQLERGDGHYRARILSIPRRESRLSPELTSPSSPPLLAPLQPLSIPPHSPLMVEIMGRCWSGLREIHDDGAGLCGWGCAGVGLGLDPDEEISLYASLTATGQEAQLPWRSRTCWTYLAVVDKLSMSLPSVPPLPQADESPHPRCKQPRRYPAGADPVARMLHAALPLALAAVPRSSGCEAGGDPRSLQ
ncbi:hypothetical protein A0H81_02808 [Grifola frondosa]|uniref:Uncharacterized protein n=1 Tax=Grifola frondosa TaxID=5627 RepID=A0A1C7MPV4_GRIFR|nr:hypothetical protein A0H81_02808 [Grifola frondosa]